MACGHKTLHDHSYETPNGRVWRCSNCGERQRWGKTWSYHGSYECKSCGYAQIDWVACSKKCAEEPEKKNGVDVIMAMTQKTNEKNQDGEKHKIHRVVEAAKLLCKNWDEGLSAQAFYRDSLVDKMIDAGLLPRSINGDRT